MRWIKVAVALTPYAVGGLLVAVGFLADIFSGTMTWIQNVAFWVPFGLGIGAIALALMLWRPGQHPAEEAPPAEISIREPAKHTTAVATWSAI